MGERTTWIALAACVAAAALVAWGGASAETVEGSVQGPSGSELRSASKKDFYWRVWNGALPEQRSKSDYSDVLAVLTGKFIGPPIGCSFSFSGGGLEPSTLAARSGTTIRIDNLDAFTHELSVDGLPGFTPLESGAGKARMIPVPAGGPWMVGDRIYGHVEGHLHSMRELVACAKVKSSGRFRFDKVPPGPYSLRILRGSEQVAMRRVTVQAGKVLQVDALIMSKSRRK